MYAGTCIILLQITATFGPNTIPFYQGQYLPTARLPITARSSWAWVMQAVGAVRGQCLKGRGLAGWADVEGAAGGKGAVLMVIPVGSWMADVWVDGVEGVRGSGTVVKGVVGGGENKTGMGTA